MGHAALTSLMGFVQVKFLKGNTNFGRYINDGSSVFPPRDDAGTTYVLLVWGFKKQDLDRCHRTEHECMGDTVWDDSFDLNSLEAQQALVVGPFVTNMMRNFKWTTFLF